MKTKLLLPMALMLMLTSLTGIAQNTNDAKPSVEDITPFGKKFSPPDFTNYPGMFLPQMSHANINTALMPGKNHYDINTIKKNLDYYRQHLKDNSNGQSLPIRGNDADAHSDHASSLSADFHLTKDINALAESNPANRSDWYVNPSYAILDQVMYFAADDGIHGNELWRSDGTAAGTFMVKDIEPGTSSSNPYEITKANGKLYFSASTATYGLREPWVSDGTESGTQLLLDINPVFPSDVAEFVAMGKKVYFAANNNDYLDALWETDGTTAGTKLVKSLGIDPGGFLISQLVKANGLLFFTFISYTTGGIELWRSDGTDGGTYHIGTNVLFYNFPTQLTSYNNKLYFASDDGTGNKLWVTDGTDAGTTLAPGNHGVLIDADYLGTTFPMLNNVLYIPGKTISKGNGLYKYDASDAAGLVKIKDLTPGSDPDFIVPSEMEVVNNTLYFKVTNYNGGVHDELWSSGGCNATTKPVKIFLPGESIYTLYNGCGNLYFVKSNDKVYGTELWKNDGRHAGTILVSDVFKGATSSYPNFLTAFKGKLFFSAADEIKGNEFFMTNDFGLGATLVKDINTVSTSGSNAGYYINTITPLGGSVVFTAFEKVHGNELYRSDGTKGGTFLLNDIIPGEKESFPFDLVSKNNAAWFIAASSDSTFSIFKTNGTKSGLQKVVPDYNVYPYYSIRDFKVADNGLVFYVLLNYSTFTYELWRSNGTAAGTLLLSPTVYATYSLNVTGNTAFFVAGDAVHGYELWKSNGNVAGTKMVKDINPGIGNSSPKGMFIYKNEVYFAANNGAGASFWKSDGTKAGTIQLRIIDPWYSSTVYGTERYLFEISNNILYFDAIDYANSKGTQLWRTDGTVAGTQAIKDISPDADSFYPIPYYLTDVNGILFFIGDYYYPGHGTELWKTDGTKAGTRLVKDVILGADSSSLGSLTSFGGKLYFTKSGMLWSSDGTPDGTTPVDDPGISDMYVYNIVPAKDQLFISGYTSKYGTELYVGKAENATQKFAAVTTDESVKTTGSFNVMLYPNPVASKATLQITGNTKSTFISIADMSGKTVWQSNSSAMFINLPTEKLTTGVYFVTVTNGTESKTIKLVKQ